MSTLLRAFGITPRPERVTPPTTGKKATFTGESNDEDCPPGVDCRVHLPVGG